MLTWLYYNIVWLLFRPLNKCLCLILKLWPSPQWSLTYTAVDVGLLVMMIWLELCTAYSSSSPFFTTTSIILCFNEHRLTQVHLEGRRKKAVKERETDRQTVRQTYSCDSCTQYVDPFCTAVWQLLILLLQFEQFQNTIGFKMTSHALAKRFWLLALEHHTFFR